MNKLNQAKELNLACATKSIARSITTSFSLGMTKARIDQEIPKMYERLLLTSKRMCAKYNRTYDAHEVVSIAYEYIVKVKAKIETTDQLKRWMTARICQEIAKSKSVTNQKISILSYEVIENIIREQEQEVDPYENEVKAVDTYSQINDRVKRRVFEVYYNEGQNTCRKMASYFNISVKSAMNLIQEMKQDLIQIAQNETF